MIVYRLRHQTIYTYGDPVAVSHNVARVLPRALERQAVADVSLSIEPAPSAERRFRDYFGNEALFFVIEEPHEELAVRVESRVVLDAAPGIAPEASPAWEEVAASVRRRHDAPGLAALECAFDSPFVRRSESLAAYARPSFPAGRPLLAGARDLCARIHAEFRYDQEATTAATPVEEVLAARHGVCQDFAHVMIGALRSLGLPARYVSGYLRSRPRSGGAARPAPPGGPDGEEALVGAEASHAWVSVFSPEQGWVDFDPTNDLLPSDRHAVLGWGRDYDDVSPIQGVTLGGGLQTLTVAVEMHPEEDSGPEAGGAAPGRPAAPGPRAG